MKRFLKGFLWNFVVLLAAMGAYRLWFAEIYWASILLLLVALAMVSTRLIQLRKRQ